MSLSKYDGKLLEMMYLLTRKQRYMNPAEVARYLSMQGKQVTDRTVRRWFDYLHRHHFDYFPYPRYSAMGLVPVWVLTDFNEKVLEAVPHKSAIVHGLDSRTLEKCLFCMYLVPAEHVKEFKGLWKSSPSRCHVFEIGSAVAFYSPFHELIDRNGIATFPEDHTVDNSHFTQLLRSNIENESETKVDDRIVNNPMMIPIIWECFRQHMSSQKIWDSFEKRAGEAAWGFVNVPKIRRRRRNGCGIRHVQNTMRDMHDNFHDFFQQTRIAYYPFYTHHNNMLYMILRLKERKHIIPLSEMISKHSISMVAYPPRDGKSRVMIYYVLTNSRETLNIISDLIQPYIDKSFDNKVIMEDFGKAAKYRDQRQQYRKEHYMMSNYHRLFDPAKCRWKFDAEDYSKKLRAAWGPPVTQRSGPSQASRR